MSGLGGVLLLLTAAAAGTPVSKLAALGFTRANVDEGVAEVAADHFAAQLSNRGFSVTTAKQLAALVGLERQKELLGCSDSDTSCLAELTNALGVDAVVTGSLGRFGQRFTVNVKVTSAKTGASLATFSSEVGSEDELPATLTRAAADIAEQLRPAPPSSSLSTASKLGLGVGYGAAAVLIGGSVLCFVLAGSDRDRLNKGSASGLSAPAAFETMKSGQLRQTVGFVLLGTGIVAALATGFAVMAFGERVSLSAGPGGVSVRGEW